jgi:nitrogen fixation NifU-like protein
VGFEGTGCAISQAAASLLSVKLHGQPLASARTVLADYLKLVSSSPNEESSDPGTSGLKHLGDLRLLNGVRKFPQRIKCATLAAHAYSAALNLAEQAVPPAPDTK